LPIKASPTADNCRFASSRQPFLVTRPQIYNQVVAISFSTYARNTEFAMQRIEIIEAKIQLPVLLDAAIKGAMPSKPLFHKQERRYSCVPACLSNELTNQS
jgi:hypothetical protein